jgi:hypothetical protein
LTKRATGNRHGKKLCKFKAFQSGEQRTSENVCFVSFQCMRTWWVSIGERIAEVFHLEAEVVRSIKLRDVAQEVVERAFYRPG